MGDLFSSDVLVVIKDVGELSSITSRATQKPVGACLVQRELFGS